jgi:hypothetical protein
MISDSFEMCRDVAAVILREYPIAKQGLVRVDRHSTRIARKYHLTAMGRKRDTTMSLSTHRLRRLALLAPQ